MVAGEAIVSATREEIVKLALAMHEAFEGPEGLGQELNCYDCGRWPDGNTPDYHPEPGQICYDLAAAILAEMEKLP
jgi:hypothetical protein